MIRGQLEVLAAQPEPRAEEVRRVERLVQAEIARISRLVDDLLLLAKSEQSEFLRIERSSCRRYVGELWDGVSLLAERRFELGPVPPGMLVADPDRLAQALRNLVANAIEHTRRRAGPGAHARGRGAPGRIRFVVDDDGPGIPPDQRERVFDALSPHRCGARRARAEAQASGSRSCARSPTRTAAGGAPASPEGGARFELELPGFEPSPAPAPAAQRAPAPTVVAGS